MQYRRPETTRPASSLRFEDGQPQSVERFQLMPAVLGTVDADEEHAVGNVVANHLKRLS